LETANLQKWALEFLLPSILVRRSHFGMCSSGASGARIMCPVGMMLRSEFELSRENMGRKKEVFCKEGIFFKCRYFKI
jgi:hypothetical protein